MLALGRHNESKKRSDMAFLGNLLWFVFGGGIISWFLWIMLGLPMAITIIGIPFAKAAFRISGFAAFPFGKELIDCRFIREPIS